LSIFSNILVPVLQENTTSILQSYSGSLYNCTIWTFHLQSTKLKYYQSYAQRKVSRPDGFIEIFFKECWGIINGEVMSAVTQFYNLNQQGLQFLNQPLVVLIPKKPNAEKILDFRLISLIHSFAKIVSKMMANRLASELGKLISCSQNASSREEAYMKTSCMCNRLLMTSTKEKYRHCLLN
jgi:hypothetical protein